MVRWVRTMNRCAPNERAAGQIIDFQNGRGALAVNVGKRGAQERNARLVPNEATSKYAIYDGVEILFVCWHEQNNVGVLRCIVARNLGSLRVVGGRRKNKALKIGDQHRRLVGWWW